MPPQGRGSTTTKVKRGVLALAVAASATALIPLAARAADPAALDGSFGARGKATTDFAPRQALATAVVVRPDGRFVVGGELDPPETGSTMTDGALVGYLRNGTLDPAFGSSGRVQFRFGRGSLLNDLALQDDGKLVAAVPLSSDQGGFGIARFKPDGSLDENFGSGGLVVRRVMDGTREVFPEAITVREDGKIVALGSNFTLFRFNADGSPDPAFGVGGQSPKPFGPEHEPLVGRDLEPLRDGALLALGVQCGTERCSLGIARYSEGGMLDPAFGSGGSSAATVFSPRSLAAHANGAATVVGESSCPRTAPPALCEYVTIRFTPDGTVDEAFGQRGRARLYDRMQALTGAVARDDGSVVATGGHSVTEHNTQFVLARFTPTGQLDPAFGYCGESRTSVGNRASAVAVVTQRDGKILVAGHAEPPGGPSRFVVLRYRGAGARDPRGRPSLIPPRVLELEPRALRRSRAGFTVRSPEFARVTSTLLLERRHARRLGISRAVARDSARLRPCVAKRMSLRLTRAGRSWLRGRLKKAARIRLRTVARNRAGLRTRTTRVTVFADLLAGPLRRRE